MTEMQNGIRPDQSEMTDEQLAVLGRDGDAAATEQLLNRYKPLVLKLSRARFLAGGEREDLIQEGMIGLYKAIRDYDETKHVKFGTFASLCVDRQMLRAIEASLREKNRPLNESLILREDLWESGVHPSGMSPESIMIDQEMEDERLRKLKGALSPLETRVLTLYLDGHSLREIAEETGRTPKSVDNAFQRIRRKSAGIRKSSGS